MLQYLKALYKCPGSLTFICPCGMGEIARVFHLSVVTLLTPAVIITTTIQQSTVDSHICTDTYQLPTTLIDNYMCLMNGLHK